MIHFPQTPPEPRKHYRDVKKALKKELLVNLFSFGKYKLSPYTACGHGCLYCDGRAEKYFVQGEFERDIVIRRNIPELLEKEISGLRERGTISIGSGTTDVYQPVEKEEKLMRRCAEILIKSDLPVSILTKSALIMRDLDLWSAVNAKNGFTLLMTITTINEKVRQIFEPYASSVDERLETIRAFKSSGCSVGILCMPLLPMISDIPADVSKLFETLHDIGVDFIMPGSLTLRPGIQKDTFLSAIQTHYPHLADQYSHIYAENRPSGMPAKVFLNGFNRSIFPMLAERGIPFLMPHRIYKNALPVYDEIYVLMHQMMEIYGAANIDISRLKSATQKYTDWLTERKKAFNRKHSLGENHITRHLLDMLESEDFSALIGNHKLAGFLNAVVTDGKVFDSMKKTLIEPQGF